MLHSLAIIPFSLIVHKFKGGKEKSTSWFGCRGHKVTHVGYNTIVRLNLTKLPEIKCFFYRKILLLDNCYLFTKI